MMTNILLLASIVHLVSGGPVCPSAQDNVVCYSPDAQTVIVLTKNGTEYDLNIDRVVSGEETVAKIGILQDELLRTLECSYNSLGRAGVSVKKEDNMISCSSPLKLDQLNLTQPFFISFSTDVQDQSTSSALYLQKAQEHFLTKHTRRQFSKAHAILMILAWLFFVPAAFIFARFGRDLYKDQTSFGVAIWFQVHRVFNILGVTCMVASLVCIWISQQKWTGVGSQSKYWTQQHTNLGVLAVALAISQPLNSLLRCGPADSRRKYFNWSHRTVGILSYVLALTTIIIAAVHFQKIWNEPLLETVLASVPISLCLLLAVFFPLMEKKSDKVFEQTSILKIPLIFFSIGVFFALSIALSLIVINGYKS